jgi:phosphate transport system substrate-binding protein
MALSPYTRTVAIDGVEPTADTIASSKYPFVCDVFAAYREDQAPESPAMKLLHWLLSPEGQAVVRESGYVPITK